MSIMEIIAVSLVIIIAAGVGFVWVIAGIVAFVLGGLLGATLILSGTLNGWAEKKTTRRMVERDLKRSLG